MNTPVIRRRWGTAIIAMAATAGLLVPASTAQAAPSIPTSWVTEQVNFILSKQLPNGAIVGAENLMMPYFANVAAIGLLDANTSTSRAAALKWMKWYIANLNPASTDVPANSVFDYEYDPATGSLTATGDFDSVDSYASTTLNLALAAYKSGDTALKNYVSSKILKYEAIANLLTYSAPTGVRIASGPDADLTMAKPSYPEAYVMDNAEVYSGLVDFAKLETLLGRTSQASYYQSWADTTKTAMIAKLWNTSTNSWDWAYASPSDTTTFYADGVAQLWPALYGVVTPTSAKATAAWSRFTTSFPTWYTVSADNYAWTSVGRAAQIMGDNTHATTYLNNIHARFAPGWTYPTSCGVTPCGEWYSNEAGWFITAGLH